MAWTAPMATPKSTGRTSSWRWAAGSTRTTLALKGRSAASRDQRGYIVGGRRATHQRGGYLGSRRLQSDRGGFTHTSYNDFEIVAANLLDNDPRRVSDRITAYALYIDPPLGRAKMTGNGSAKLRARGR